MFPPPFLYRRSRPGGHPRLKFKFLVTMAVFVVVLLAVFVLASTLPAAVQ